MDTLHDILIANPHDHGDISNLLADYKIWRDYQEFYNRRHYSNLIVDPTGIPCFHYRDVSRINARRAPSVIINNLHESIHSANWFRQYRPDQRYIILSGGQWDRDQITWDFNYQNINTNWWLLEMTDTYLSSRRFCFYLEKEYVIGHKPWIFISTTGNVRPERSLLIDLLKSDISYTNYNIRYSGENIGMDHDLDVVDISTGQFDPYTLLLDRYHHNISQTLPIRWYNQAYVNLVVETDIDYQNSFCLSEKTIKCLITGMPFVVYATPFFLENLRVLGFRSYSEVWDESYDRETDLPRRCRKIVDLMNHLHDLDWPSHFAKLQQIADHNRATFFRLNHLQDKNFEAIHSCLCDAWIQHRIPV